LNSVIHVILGGSAGGIFTRNWPRQQLLIDHDVLSCGPTPQCENFEAWQSMRFEFWKSVVPGNALDSLSKPSLADDAQRLRDAGRIHVWAATSLSEQLFIAHVAHLVDVLAIDLERVRLLQFEYLRGRNARILGMGELNESTMAEHPEPAPLAPETADDYRAAWTALTSPDPTLFERFENNRPNANPWLKQAMQLMLRRFPDRKSGLVHWDRVLLAKVRAHGPKAARVIGYAMADDRNDGDFVGDYFLFGRLLRMGDEQLPQPLLALAGDRVNIRQTEVVLTPFGLDVLEGKVSSYPTNPIEDWAAGVRISSDAGDLLFNDAGKLVRV